MTKLRLSLKNLGKAARNSLIIFSLLLPLRLLSGCSDAPNEPTYNLQNLSNSLEKIMRDEYKITITSHISGKTLWIYLPLKESLFTESEKPQEYLKRFELRNLNTGFQNQALNLKYNIREVPETKESQKVKFSPDASDKMYKLLRTVRRVLFSFKNGKDSLRFFSIVTADIISGIELSNINYTDDFKKAAYELISWVEYQHRTLEDIHLMPKAIGDSTGAHLKFYDVNFIEFLTEQIKQRIKTKFTKPEVHKGVNIDKEIIKSAKQVLEIYQFKNFSRLEIENLASGVKNSLSSKQALNPEFIEQLRDKR